MITSINAPDLAHSPLLAPSTTVMLPVQPPPPSFPDRAIHGVLTPLHPLQSRTTDISTRLAVMVLIFCLSLLGMLFPNLHLPSSI